MIKNSPSYLCNQNNQMFISKNKKINLDTDFTYFSIINSKGMTELNLKFETIKNVEENRKLLVTWM